MWKAGGAGEWLALFPLCGLKSVMCLSEPRISLDEKSWACWESRGEAREGLQGSSFRAVSKRPVAGLGASVGVLICWMPHEHAPWVPVDRQYP